MSDKIKTEIISIAYTFGTSFVLAVATNIQLAGTVEWTSAFWIAIVIAAARSAVKTVINTFVPAKLGGRAK